MSKCSTLAQLISVLQRAGSRALTLAALALTIGCGEDFCARAADKAESCSVDNLEIEDDAEGCRDATAECRADCIENAPCEEIEASFAGGTDRETEAFLCYDACGI